MDKNNLDNNIREALEGHEVYIDKNFIWNGIQKRKKKNRSIFFIFISGALLLSAYFLSAHFSQSDQQSILKPEKTAEHNVNQDLELENSYHKEIIKDLTNEKANETINENATSDAAEKEIKDHSDNQVEKTRTLKTDLNSKSYSYLTATNPLYARKPFAESKIITPTLLGVKTYQKKETKLSNNHKPGLESKAIHVVSTVAKNLFASDSNRIPTLALKLFETNSEMWRPSIMLESKSKSSYQKVKNELFLNLNSSYSFIDRNLAYPEGVEFADRRSLYEKPLEDIGLGFDLQYKLKNGIYLKSGVEWRRLQESLEYSEKFSETREEGGHIILEIIYPDMTVEFQTGTALVQYDTMRNYTAYNKYDRINIPIGIGYERALVGNFLACIDANLSFNLRHQYTGYLVNADSRVESDPDIFKSNIGIQSFVSVGLGYQGTKNISLWLKPYAQLNRWQVNKDTNPVEQSYRLYGARASLRWSLN